MSESGEVDLQRLAAEVAREQQASSSDDSSSSDSDDSSSDTEEKKESERETLAMLNKDLSNRPTYEGDAFFGNREVSEEARAVLRDLMLRIGMNPHPEQHWQDVVEEAVADFVSNKQIAEAHYAVGEVVVDSVQQDLKLTFGKDVGKRGLHLCYFSLHTLTGSDKVKTMTLRGRRNAFMQFPQGVIPMPLFRAPLNPIMTSVTLENIIVTGELAKGLSNTSIVKLRLEGLLVDKCTPLYNMQRLEDLSLALVPANSSVRFRVNFGATQSSPVMTALKYLEMNTGWRILSTVTEKSRQTVQLRATSIECIELTNTRHLELDSLVIMAHLFDFSAIYGDTGLKFAKVRAHSINFVHPETAPTLYFGSQWDCNLTAFAPQKMQLSTWKAMNGIKEPVVMGDVYSAKFSGNILLSEDCERMFQQSLEDWQTMTLTMNGEAAISFALIGTRFPLRDPPAEEKPTIRYMYTAQPALVGWRPPHAFLKTLATVQVLMIPVHPLLAFESKDWCKLSDAHIVFTNRNLAWQTDLAKGKLLKPEPEDRDAGDPIKIQYEHMKAFTDEMRYVPDGKDPNLDLVAWIKRTTWARFPSGTHQVMSSKQFLAEVASRQPSIVKRQIYPEHVPSNCGPSLSGWLPGFLGGGN